MTTGRSKVTSTAKLPRIYGPNDPRAERAIRLGAARAQAQEAAVAAATEAATAAQAAVGDVFDLTDLVGTSFPEGPINGRPFWRTDQGNALFVWDETREKWLGTIANPSYTNGTTLASGNNLRLFQGPAGDSGLGYELEWDATLVSVVSSRNTAGSSTTYNIRAGSTVRHAHVLPGADRTHTESTVDEDFSAGEIVNVILASDMTGGGTITCIFQRRAT